MQNQEMMWITYGYTRLSKDDRDKNESNSIKNQRDMILDFASNNPAIRIVEILSDDGYTGANFERNAFMTLLDRIEDGSINCVIVKDFSRLGRDHVGTLKYIQRYFESKDIRFISINDRYDSLTADMTDANTSLIVPFKTIMDEAFLEDISTKTKSQLALKRKNGEFICNYATYGYAKASEKKLIVDETAASIVKSIFERKIQGQSEQQIANDLNSQGVLSPAEYKKSIGPYSTPFAVKDKSLWTALAIKRILANRVYIGTLEQGKRAKVSYRVKKCLYKPRELWSVHNNNHDPIVTEADFRIVQDLMRRDTRSPGKNEQLHLFSGMVICRNCGQSMIVKTTTKSNGKRYVNYICSTHRKDGTCKNNGISGIAIEKLVLESIRKHIDTLLSASELAGNVGLNELKRRKKAALESMIDKAISSVERNNSYFAKACASVADGLINGDEFIVVRDDIRGQIEIAERNIFHLQREIENLADDPTTNHLLEMFKRHENITALDRHIVVSLIHSIIVYDGAKDVEIRFRFDGGFDDIPEYDYTDMERPVKQDAP